MGLKLFTCVYISGCLHGRACSPFPCLLPPPPAGPCSVSTFQERSRPPPLPFVSHLVTLFTQSGALSTLGQIGTPDFGSQEPAAFISLSSRAETFQLKTPVTSITCSQEHVTSGTDVTQRTAVRDLRAFGVLLLCELL